MKLLKALTLFLFDLTAFLGAVYDILDERREMRKLKRILEDYKRYAELENYSTTPADNLEGWVDKVYEKLCKRMEEK